MRIPLRVLVVAQLGLAAVGAAIVITFIIAAGVDYRIREDQGLPPAYTPQWMATWIDVGFMMLGTAAVGLAVTGAIALIRHWARRT